MAKAGALQDEMNGAEDKLKRQRDAADKQWREAAEQLQELCKVSALNIFYFFVLFFLSCTIHFLKSKKNGCLCCLPEFESV